MASVDLLGVTEVWLHLVAAGIKLPLMDATGFDVQHIVAELRSKWWQERRRKKFSLSLATCTYLLRHDLLVARGEMNNNVPPE